jgi:uncharacterized protein (TIGR02246 family)
MSSKLARSTHAFWPLSAMATIVVIAVSAQAAEKKEPAGRSDEAAIRDSAEDFVRTFNRGDAKAVAALWTPTGSLADDQGRVFKGRKAIEDEYAAFFKEHAGVKMEVAVQSVELPAAGVAIEDGMARVAAKDGAPPAASRYTAVHVLTDGKWLMASVRESSIDLPSNYGRLRDFEWLVGTWETKSDAVTIRTTVRWMADKSFLQREYTVRNGGVTRSSGVQIIGWDAQAGKVRSWSFDSSGGNGTGLWTPTPDGWRIESKGMLADGTLTASQDFLIRVRGEDNVLGWRSTNRKIGDQSLPDLREVVLERVAEKTTHD